MTTRCDAVVVGGGMYGAFVATSLATAPAHGRCRVVLMEREDRLFSRATTVNQARIHHGYHYPRSLLTSLRSRVNYQRFVSEYADCVDEGFTHYYAIARHSKVSAAQFVQFCRRIDAPLEVAPSHVQSLFAAERIESVFRVREGAFNATLLGQALERKLAEAGVDVMYRTEIARVESAGEGFTVYDPSGHVVAETGVVFNCTYSNLNAVLTASGAESITLRHELAELALVEPPAPLQGAAVTVIDGPFFSLMPHPPTGLCTLSHVRYTPHSTWTDEQLAQSASDSAPHRSSESRVVHMVHDAARYAPMMRDLRYIRSLWEVKSVMPRSDRDDSRPILFRESAALPGLVSVLGSKIDNVYDVQSALQAWLGGSRAFVGTQ